MARNSNIAYNAPRPIPPISSDDVNSVIVYNAITCVESPSPQGGNEDQAYYLQGMDNTAHGGIFTLVWMWAGGFGELSES